MAAPVRKSMAETVHFRVFDDLSLLNSVAEEAGKVSIQGKKVALKTSDPESTVEISAEPKGTSAVFTYPLDTDTDSSNGRLYLEDRFLFNPAEKTLIHVKRSFHAKKEGAALAGPWATLYSRLKKIEQTPINKNDPRAIGFFRDVVLKISGLKEAGPEEAESSLFGPRMTLHRAMTPIAPPPPPSSLEEAHFHRLFTLLEIEGLRQPILDELGRSLYRPPPLSENPVILPPLEEEGTSALHRRLENEKNPQNQVFLQGLIALSERNFTRANLIFTALYDSIPSSQIIRGWIRDYEQAQKNLDIAKLMSSIAREMMENELKASRAWIRNFRPSSPSSYKNTEKDAEVVKGLFDEIERRIATGLSDTVDQAFLHLETEERPDQKKMLAKIQSESFSGGLLTNLRRASKARDSIQEGTLLTVVEELRKSLNPCSAEKLYEFLSQANDPRVAHSARYQLERLRMGDGEKEPLDEIFLTQLSDPLTIASLLMGTEAFNFASTRILSLTPANTARSLVLSNLGGVVSESLGFEASRRFLGHAFVGEMDYGGSFIGNVAKNQLSFGVLRFVRLGTERGVFPFATEGQPLAKAFLPFIPVYLVDRVGTTLPLQPPKSSSCGKPSKESREVRGMKAGIFFTEHLVADWLTYRLLMGRIPAK